MIIIMIMIIDNTIRMRCSKSPVLGWRPWSLTLQSCIIRMPPRTSCEFGMWQKGRKIVVRLRKLMDNYVLDFE